MLPIHSSAAHAHPSSNGFCLPHTPNPSHPASEKFAVAQGQHRSPSSGLSPNVSVSTTETTIAAGAPTAIRSTSQEVERNIATPAGSLRTRQTNRLQLRNAGFRAAPIAPRRVSPFSIFSPSREPSPSGPSAAGSFRTPNASTESSILQEIHRTSQRKGSHARPSLNGLFTGSEPSGRSPSSNDSFAMSPRTEYLKRNPENDENIPPLSQISSNRGTSPFANRASSLRSSKGSVRGRSSGSHRISRSKGAGGYRPGGLQVEAYIDSLEAEIASLETRLSTVNSPSVTSVQAAKLRSLTAENRNLKQEVADWETKYEERIDDAVHERTRSEAGLHRRIRELEEDVRSKEERCLLLEAQVKECERRAKQAEECEKMMSSRVDLLTSMVANSPNKEREGWATAPATPMFEDFPEPLRPSQRVRSVLLPPRTDKRTGRSLSPSRRETITSAEDVFGWHAPADKADNEDHAINQNNDGDDGDNEQSSTCSGSNSGQRSVLTASTQPTSLDIAEMRSRSPTRRERPISLLSTSSFSASWGLPASIARSHTEVPSSASPTDPSCRPTAQAKRMRRFHSSAGGLKPLILPSTASSSSASVASPRRLSLLSPSRLGSVSELPPHAGYPLSAPVENMHKEHFQVMNRASSGVSYPSQKSFDPTTAFFESSRESTLMKAAETPSLAAKRRSKEMRVRELERMKALQQLEGNYSESIDEMIAGITNEQNISERGQDSSPLQQDAFLSSSCSTLAEELRDARTVSSSTIASQTSFGNRRAASSFSRRASLRGWADDLASTPSTPSRSHSPALTETPRAPFDRPLPGPARHNEGRMSDEPVTSEAYVGHVLEAPRISIHAGTVSHASSESTATQMQQNYSSGDANAEGLFERIARLASKILPLRNGASGHSQDVAKSTLSHSRPVLLARKIFERSWARTSDRVGLLSPFRLGGLGWWLFGLLNSRAGQERIRERDYQELAGGAQTSSHDDDETVRGVRRPRKVSYGTEEWQIGFPSAIDTDKFTPEQLRRLELDGPGECVMMRAEPQMLFSEHAAMLGLSQLPSSPRHHNYGSITTAYAERTVEARADSAVERVFGRSHMSCDYCKEPVARKRLRVWAKFGLALVLAVGVAILEGPEAVMGDQDQHSSACGHAKRDSEDFRDEAEVGVDIRHSDREQAARWPFA